MNAEPVGIGQSFLAQVMQPVIDFKGSLSS